MSGAVKFGFATLEEALVVRGLLLARGIPVAAANRHHASLEWWLTPGLGGVFLMIPQQCREAVELELRDSVKTADRVLEAEFGDVPSTDGNDLFYRLRIWLIIGHFLAIKPIIAIPFVLLILLTLFVAHEVFWAIYLFVLPFIHLLPPFLQPGPFIGLLTALALLLLFWKITQPRGQGFENLEAEGKHLPSYDL